MIPWVLLFCCLWEGMGERGVLLAFFDGWSFDRAF
jgi:hypothetical protein